MVALAILAVAVTSIVQLFAGTLRTVGRAGNVTRATAYARSLLEEAYTKDTPDEIEGHYILEEGFEADRSANLEGEEGGASIYAVEVRVTWPPSGETSLTGWRLFYEPEFAEED
jgi:type II secretory pathway pseudopilin PulG